MNAATSADSLFFDPDPIEHAITDVLDNASAAELARLFGVMADVTRVRMLSALAGAELCVTELRLMLNMEQSAVSHQLRTLRKSGLVRCRKVGRQVFYSLDVERIPEFFMSSLKRIRRR